MCYVAQGLDTSPAGRSIAARDDGLKDHRRAIYSPCRIVTHEANESGKICQDRPGIAFVGTW